MNKHLRYSLKLKQLLLLAFLLTVVSGFSIFVFASKSNANIWDSELTGENIEFVTYNSNNLDYTFKRPVSWHVYEVPSMSYLRVENLDARSLDALPHEVRRQYFKIEVVVLPAKGLSLSDWIERQNTTSYPLPKVLEQRSIDVDGYSAVYQVEQFGSLVHPVVFVKKDESIYLLNISSDDEVFRPVKDEFIKQFKLIQ